MFNGTAESGIAWYGFSSLSGDAEFTQVPAGSYLTVQIVNPAINVWCYNPNSDASANWVPGTGNGGTITTTLQLEEVEASKIKQLTKAQIEILLDRYDDPDSVDEFGESNFENICQAENAKLPVLGSAWIEAFTVNYYLYKSDIEKPSLLGIQECSYKPEYWPTREEPIPGHYEFDCETVEGKPNQFD
jgi:hypothetical protein